MSEDGDDQFNIADPAARPNAGLSMDAMLTELQRLHIERMLEAVQGGIPNPAVMAQINRYLRENGIVTPPLEGKVIEGRANRPALPHFQGKRFDE